MLDLLIVSVPSNYLTAPMAASALLKSAVEQHGFSCETVDFSMLCFQEIFNKDYSQYLDWIKIFPGEFNFTNCNQWQQQQLEESLSLFVDLINKKNPKLLGISVFSYWQQRFTYLACKRLKALRPDIKIVIGGMGCSAAASNLNGVTHLTFFDKKSSFANFMLSKKLTEFAVINDGELELVNLLQNQASYQNIAISNESSFEHAVTPNYDNYELDQYLFLNNEKFLMIQGSKGCVRQCVFCSEHSNYSRYYFKNGNNIADEIIELSQKYNVFKFYFTDSLVNGSLPVFKEWVKKLAEYNIANPNKAIKWHGNYICRKNNSISDQEYLLIKQSGAHGLTIGAESGSNRVLTEMNKQSTVEDLLYELEKFKQYNIDCTLLMMVGFYNETWDDFLKTLTLLKNIQKYVLARTVTSIRAGYTLTISDWSLYNQDDFVVDTTNKFNWLYKKNPSLTLNERIKRRIVLQEFCDELGIPVSYANEDLTILENIANEKANFREIESAHH